MLRALASCDTGPEPPPCPRIHQSPLQFPNRFWVFFFVIILKIIILIYSTTVHCPVIYGSPLQAVLNGIQLLSCDTNYKTKRHNEWSRFCISWGLLTFLWNWLFLQEGAQQLPEVWKTKKTSGFMELAAQGSGLRCFMVWHYWANVDPTLACYLSWW